MISIVDYGVGNLGSIKNMLKHLKIDSIIVSTPSEIEKADKLILPGVGSWDNGLNKLKESQLLDVLNKRVLIDGVPVLGICLGMQLLFESSEEGRLDGLGWVSGIVKKFDFSSDDIVDKKLKVPHMGWNIVKANKLTKLTEFNCSETRFYFVHSYHVVAEDANSILMTCNYGYDFTCAIQQNNIWGVQFHPEKSHKFGMCLMKSFAEL